MADTIIKVENLSKKYIINHQQEKEDFKTLKDAITDATHSLAKSLIKPKKGKLEHDSREEFWALKDVSFEIKQGDRVGIIGRNGAGKSTLLKILSRITEPTEGQITIKGRVASLLEVGTGFHPELTGRENIYLNGAILGMSKAEIKRKFDEIVDFAEVERFLDTPVKRYSSGMYVRLAFAVAAHLEPEILIVDEVLAVGDVQFQKKCLGKMQSVSENEGRTVLFVSHNMDAIQRLCSKCMLFEQGKLKDQGNTNDLIARYFSNSIVQASPKRWIDMSKVSRIGTGEARFIGIKYSSLNDAISYKPYSRGNLEFLINIQSNSKRTIGSLGITICDMFGNKLVNADSIEIGKIIKLESGNNFIVMNMKKIYLKPGTYIVALWLADSLTNNPFDYIESAFEIEIIDFRREELGTKPNSDGSVVCDFEISQKITGRCYG